jgi:hypothetical protein
LRPTREQNEWHAGPTLSDAEATVTHARMMLRAVNATGQVKHRASPSKQPLPSLQEA